MFQFTFYIRDSVYNQIMGQYNVEFAFAFALSLSHPLLRVLCLIISA